MDIKILRFHAGKLVREDCRITCEIKKFFTVGNKQGIIYIQ